MASGNPIGSAESGVVIECELTVTCPEAVEYAMVEDPIPSNCRVVERGAPDEGEEWDGDWSDMAIRDDRVTFFSRVLPKGVSKFTYLMRAESPGVSGARPTLVQNMYDPASSAWTVPSRLEVRR